MRLRNGIAATVTASALALFGLAGLAWGCVNADTATVDVAPGRGPADTVVRVTGANWVGGKPVDISLGGRPLAEATADAAGRFSVSASIPPSATGLHVVHASSDTKSARTHFEVTAPAPVETGADSGGSGTDGRPTPATTSGRVTGAAPPDEDTAAGPPPETASGAPAASPDPGSARSTAAGGGIPLPARGGSGDVRPATQPGRAPAPGATTAASGAAVPGDQQQRPLAPSANSALGDLWSGFATGPDSGVRPRGLGDLSARTGSSGPSPEAVGVGVLVAGVVAMFAGFAFAETRRRRVPVDRSADPGSGT